MKTTWSWRRARRLPTRVPPARFALPGLEAHSYLNRWQPVALTVVGADRLPTEQDRALVVAAQALLMQDPHFQALKQPTLSRCEVNANVQETEQGYLYLRFDVAGAVPRELWAHWGRIDKVA